MRWRNLVPFLAERESRLPALAREHAAHRRRVARSDALRSVGELGVAVVLPLGLLVLPGFVLVAIVPMALGIWSGAGLA